MLNLAKFAKMHPVCEKSDMSILEFVKEYLRECDSIANECLILSTFCQTPKVAKIDLSVWKYVKTLLESVKECMRVCDSITNRYQSL